jgi:hypothetical protein
MDFSKNKIILKIHISLHFSFLFSIRRFVPFDIFSIDVLSHSAIFPFDILSRSAFFPFGVFSIWRFLLFDLLSHSTLVPFDVLYHSAFFPFDVVSHSAFCLLTFCRSTFCTFGVCSFDLLSVNRLYCTLCGRIDYPIHPLIHLSDLRIYLFLTNKYKKPPVYSKVFVYSRQLGGFIDYRLSSSFQVRG